MRQVRFFLLLAAALAAISFSPIGDAWQVMVLPPQAMQEASSGADATVYMAPHEQFFRWVIDAWHSGLRNMANANLISEREAARIMAHGFSMAALLQVLSGISACLALVSSMLGLSVFSASHPGGLRQISSELSEAQLAVTNLLLNSDAQPVAEPLADIGRRIQSVNDALQSFDKSMR